MLVKIKTVQLVVILLLADFVLTSILNGTKEGGPNNLLETRRQRGRGRGKRGRSTSSSSGDRDKESGRSGDKGESLEMTSDTESAAFDADSHDKPKSSRERTGWRKWHRKCAPCPEDMRLKWRDPRIRWICGGYQRARRSFKSLCMMHYRNCQDGTMFVKIYDHRCQLDNSTGENRGQHFFYDYRVQLEGDSSRSGDTSSSEAESASSV